MPLPELARGEGSVSPLLKTVLGGPAGFATETVGAGAEGAAAGALGVGAGAGVVVIAGSLSEIEFGTSWT